MESKIQTALDQKFTFLKGVHDFCAGLDGDFERKFGYNWNKWQYSTNHDLCSR